MKKSTLLLVVLVVLLPVIFACNPPDISADLGEEISLAIGQKVLFASENLEVRFKQIVEDSRCARDVVCPWAGRVVCLLQIIQDDVSQEITVTQPGLTDDASQQSFQDYNYTFNVEPYPQQAEKPIKTSEYRLILTVSQVPKIVTVTENYNIDAGQKKVISIVLKKNDRLDLSVTAASHDIGIRIDDPSGQAAVPFNRVESGNFVVIAKEDGVYVVTLDNSYSIFTPKSITVVLEYPER